MVIKMKMTKIRTRVKWKCFDSRDSARKRGATSLDKKLSQSIKLEMKKARH